MIKNKLICLYIDDDECVFLLNGMFLPVQKINGQFKVKVKDGIEYTSDNLFELLDFVDDYLETRFSL